MRKTLLVTVLLALLGAGVLGGVRRGLPGRSPPKPALAETVPGSAVAPSGPSGVCDLDAELSHDLEWRAAVSPVKEGQGTLDFSMVISGRLVTTVVEATGRECRIHAELRALRVTNAGTGAAGGQQLAEALSRPFQVSHRPDGAVLRIHLAPGTAALPEGLLRTLVSALQFTRGSGPRWQSAELDPVGEYLAEYRQAGGTRYHRDKVRYLRLATSNGLTRARGAVPQLAAARSLFVLDDAGLHVREANVHESTRVGVTAAGVAFEGTHTITLRLAGVRREGGKRGLSLAGLVSRAITTEARDLAPALEAADRATWGGTPLPELMRGLAQALAGNDDAGVRRLEFKLGALLRLQPELVPAVMAELQRQPETALSAINGLASAGHAQAQEALAEIAAGREVPVEQRRHAVEAMTLLERPTAQLSETLTGLLDAPDEGVRDRAGLALGATAYHGRKHDPARANTSVDLLLDRLAGASDEEAVRIMRALGNAGDPRALAALGQRMASPSPEIRAAAANALRLIDDPRADALIGRAMIEDRDPTVRYAALTSAEFRRVDRLLGSLKAVCMREADPGLRQRAVEVLGAAVDQSDQVLAVLDWSSRNDPAEEIRTVAARFLARPRL